MGFTIDSEFNLTGKTQGSLLTLPVGCGAPSAVGQPPLAPPPHHSLSSLSCVGVPRGSLLPDPSPQASELLVFLKVDTNI